MENKEDKNFKIPFFDFPEEIKNSAGYKKLEAAVKRDYENDKDRIEKYGRPFHDYGEKLKWVIDRAVHYSEKTKLSVTEILDAWENDRTYWYMNYYQDCNQPEIKSDNVKIFDTVEDFKKSTLNKGFRCPCCNGISKNPNECDTKILVKSGRKKAECDWKSYGLFGTMGKGAHVFIKEKLRIYEIFMPVAWENEKEKK